MPSASTQTTKYRSKYNKKKAKWREQKLAVGTVIQIAKKVAKKLDEKNIRYLFSNVYFAVDGYSWDSVCSLPPKEAYRIVRTDALESKLISDLSNLVQDVSLVAGGDEERSVTVGIKAIQARISIRNANVQGVRYEAMLIFVPNLTGQTSDGVDFLRPDVFMLYKNGSGNLLNDGLAKSKIRNQSTGASSVRTFTILARKVGYIRGFIAGTTNSPNVATKRFTMTKYFKRERRHNCKQVQAGGANMFTDGNYYFCLHSDISTGGTIAVPTQLSIGYTGAASIKLRIVNLTQPITLQDQ